MGMSFRLKVQILCIYVAMCIISEIFYREPLFFKSLFIQKEMYQSASPTLIRIYKYITKLGTQIIMLPILIIFLLFIPLNKTYTYLSILVYSNYFDNVLKLIYGSPRPFWLNPSIFRVCDAGFGNPSGHSFTSTSIYLTIWNILTDTPYFTSTLLGKLLKIIILFLFIILILLIILSRLYLSVHSINQVLHGTLLGVALYAFYCHVLELNKAKHDEFKRHIYEKKSIIIHSVMFIVYVVVVLMVGMFRKNNEEDYIDVIEGLCPDMMEYRKFNKDGVFIALTLMFGIGAYYGLVFLYYKLGRQFINKENVVVKWNEVVSMKQKSCLMISVIPFFAGMVLYKVVPKDNVVIFYIFGVSIPYMITGFLLFGVYIYICVACQIGNKEFYTLPEISRKPTDGEENKGSVTIEIQFNQ